MLFGIFISFRELQNAKAPVPICITYSKFITFSIFSNPVKHQSSIITGCDGSCTVSK